MTEAELIELDDLIDNYITKKLSKREEEAFKLRLKDNPDLQEKVKINEAIRQMVIEYQMVKLKEKMNLYFTQEKARLKSRSSISSPKRKQRNKKSVH